MTTVWRKLYEHFGQKGFQIASRMAGLERETTQA